MNYRLIFFMTAIISSATPLSGVFSQSVPVVENIDNRGDQLYALHYLNPGKETVILLHGGPGFPGDLTEVATMLNARYQVVVFHQRGTRNSPCPGGDYSMEAYMSDIEAIAKHYQIDRFHLWGHSWGGLYAQIYAQNYPQRLLSLFLCSPGSGTGSQWKQTEKEVMRLNRSKCTRAEWAVMGWNNLLGIMGSDRAYRRLFRQVLKNYNSGFVESAHQGIEFDYLSAKAVNKTRPQIVAYPVLSPMPNPEFRISIVYGDGDIYQASKNFVAERYPTAQIFTLPHCGHIPWLHNPEGYREVLKKHFGG